MIGAEGKVREIQGSRQYQEGLIQRVTEEALRAQEARYILPIHLGLTELLFLVGNIQVALRHPHNSGLSADGARAILAQVIERLRQDGWPAHAEFAEMGNRPEYDR